jgi:hypothetical protein
MCDCERPGCRSIRQQRGRWAAALFTLTLLGSGFVARGQEPAESKPPEPGKLATVPPTPAPNAGDEQVKEQTKQRILGIIPAFNATESSVAVTLSPKQKLRLAFRSAVDPFQFLIASIDSGISQAENDHAGYGQGLQGYGKRFGASYLDSFNGTIIGNGILPGLLHQDARYFRKGTGSFKSRLLYSMLSTVRCKSDDGRWQPNYSNLLGNVAAGGISNLYYPQEDRGVGLTFGRAFTVSAEGAIGAFLFEFWPDVSRKLKKKH